MKKMRKKGKGPSFWAIFLVHPPTRCLKSLKRKEQNVLIKKMKSVSQQVYHLYFETDDLKQEPKTKSRLGLPSGFMNTGRKKSFTS